MEFALKTLAVFGLTFILLTMGVNFLNVRYPRIPGDIYISKPGLSFFLPFTSAVVITILLMLTFTLIL